MYTIQDKLIVIPVRMKSKRFPGKPLVVIRGKSMIQHVYEKAIAAQVGDVVVACCDAKISKHLKSHNIPYVMTTQKLKSGTDRVFQAVSKLTKEKKYKYIINLQGDLPNIFPKDIKSLVKILISRDTNMVTLVSKIVDKKKIYDKNIVKVALSRNNRIHKAIYFSRSPIPYGAKIYYEHVGIYGYNIKILEKFVQLKEGSLEKLESLEQLRALENGINIDVDIIRNTPISIDTPEDLNRLLGLAKTKV